ncbi:uncharacterized protein B0I36DRAFT_101364 [Microdochium trichocladiopsis]|uniref:Uncharacterized protein n=1 Tax=Microdochium trichocladiopsis TaxID=1682393 RepID=A0A9P8Y956_9PEZI|nr:uncharacterized protein B0I36DRAFT_101364 [Microdochium trichocladiopsis]KAH7032851.1 hypothetical protein B0I36DRAFT_101364 [Microdochium trichocladiopsis]
MAFVDHGLRDHVDITRFRSRLASLDSASDAESDHHRHHRHPDDHRTGILPMLPAAGANFDEAGEIFPRTVASSMASLRSLYGPATRHTRHFSPLSRRRQSFPEPPNLRTRPSSNTKMTRQMHSRARLDFESGQARQPSSFVRVTNHSRSRLVTPADSSLGSEMDSRTSGATYEDQSLSDRTDSYDGEREPRSVVHSAQDDPVLKQLYKSAAKLRYRRTNLSELIESLRTARYNADARRRERNKAELAFLEAARAQMTDSPHLIELLDDMHRACNEQEEVDQRFREMIDYLHEAELALDKQERVFFSTAARSNTAYAESASDEGTAESSSVDGVIITRPHADLPYELLGITGLRPPNIHPVLSKLQALIRQLKLIDELLINLRGRKQSLDKLRDDLTSLNVSGLRRAAHDAAQANQLDTKAVHALDTKFSHAINRDDADFLRSYPSDLKEAIRERDQTLQRVAYFESECRRLGLISSVDHLPRAWSALWEESPEEIQLADVTRTAPRRSVFPLLLSSPGALLESEPKMPYQALTSALALPHTNPSRQKLINQSLREVNIHNLLKGDAQRDQDGRVRLLSEDNMQALATVQKSWHKAEWINRWLLHKLHMSSMEAETFYATSRIYTEIVDRGQWQRDALRFWTRDQAANPENVATDPTTTGNSIKQPLPSTSDLFVDRRRSDSDMHLYKGHALLNHHEPIQLEIL